MHLARPSWLGGLLILTLAFRAAPGLAQGMTDTPEKARAEQDAQQERQQKSPHQEEPDDDGPEAAAAESDDDDKGKDKGEDKGDASEEDDLSAEVAGKLGEGKISLMVPDFRATTPGVSEGDLETLAGLAVFQLSKVKRFDVVSGADIREMLQLEADRTAAGCSESSCLSEVADALGAQLIVTGQVGRLGARYVVQLALIYVAEAKVVSRAELTVRKLAEAPQEMIRAVHELAQSFGGIPGAEEKLAEAESSFTRMAVEAANDPDLVMLFAVMGTGLAALFGPLGLIVTPLLQAAVLYFFGDDLAGREYPYWWAAIVAGWGTYLVALVVGGLAVGGGAAAGGLYGGGAMAFGVTAVATLIVFGLEPLVVWFAGTYRAEDLDVFTEGAEPPPDASEVSSLGLFSPRGPLRSDVPLIQAALAGAGPGGR